MNMSETDEIEQFKEYINNLPRADLDNLDYVLIRDRDDDGVFVDLKIPIGEERLFAFHYSDLVIALKIIWSNFLEDND